MKKQILTIIGIITFFISTVNAQILWNADPTKGTSVFKLVGSNCASPGSVTVVNDAQKGQVFLYNKPQNLERCESHGIDINGVDYHFNNNTTYYLGWWTKLNMITDNNAFFQWKAYDNHIQNWPAVLKMFGGKLIMLQRQPNNQVSTIFTGTMKANEWTHFALGLHLSDQLTGGWIELYINGIKQTFSDGSQRYACRLYDGEHVCPKWGVYGADADAYKHYLADAKIGFTYNDVKMPVVTSIDENNISSEIIYPNPSKGSITITNNNGNAIRIYNQVGSLVFEKTEIKDDLFVLDISSLATGMYIAQISQLDGRSRFLKLIVEE